MAGSWRPYGRSDDVVRADLKRGHAAEVATATWLRSFGLHVDLLPQKIRETYEEREEASDPGWDLVVEGKTVQVRHRPSYHFTGPADYGFNTFWFVDNPPWDDAGFVKPQAYVHVSGPAQGPLVGFIAVFEDDYGHHFHRWMRDTTRFQDNGEPAWRDGIHVDMRYARTLDQFVAWVKPGGPPVSFVEGWDPEDLDPADLDLLLDDPIGRLQRQARDENRRTIQAQKRREYLALRALEDQEKRQWIAEGNDLRQPEEYRGRVYDVPDKDGVHPTAFPPLREGAGAELTEEFIAFQQHNQTRYATHPEYYCVDCKIRYNARDGGRCGPCLGKLTPSEAQGRMPGMTRRSGRTRPETPQYPL